MHDARLHGALEHLSTGVVKVLSLDVFDTLVWRQVPEPIDVFWMLGVRLREGGRLGSMSPQLFARLRIAAEARARREMWTRERSTEVTLAGIYAAFPEHILPGSDRHQAAESEVELEGSLTRPNLDVLEFATLAQQRFGARVVLVSNTYFSAAQIHTLIDHEPFRQLTVHRVFTSSDVGVHKAGGLFERVLHMIDEKSSGVLHVGDDASADVAPAAALGIRVCHVPRYREPFREVLRAEGVIERTWTSLAKPMLNSHEGDFGLTHLRAQTLQRAELSVVPDSLRPFWEYGAAILGPALTGFAEWSHVRAQHHGGLVMHCPMREGKLLAAMLNEAGSYLSSPISASPVWLSRFVTGRAAIVDASPAELLSLIGGRIRPTLAEYCTQLGIDLSRMKSLQRHADERLDDPELAGRTVARIASDGVLATQLRSSSAALRKRLIDHLQPALRESNGVFILADVGWGATTQLFLSKALRAGGVDVRIVGLYMMTNQSAFERLFDGVESEGYLSDAGVPEEARWVLRTPDTVERSVLADTGSLIDFSAECEPVLGPSPPQSEAASVGAVQAGIRTFQLEWARYARALPQTHSTLSDRARPYLLNVMRRAAVRPTPAESAMLGTWWHDENFGGNARAQLVAPQLRRITPYLSPSDVLRLTHEDTYWPQGTVAEVGGARLTAAVATVADGQLPADIFESARPGDASNLYAMGPLGPLKAIDQTVHTNVDGRSCARATIHDSGQAIEAIRFDPSREPCVIRVDWLRLECLVDSQTSPIVISLEDDAALSSLTLANCTHAPGRLLISQVGRPRIILPVATRLPRGTYRIDVEIAFALMPLTPDRGGQAGVQAAASGRGSGGLMVAAQTAARAARMVRWMARRAKSEYEIGGAGAVRVRTADWLRWVITSRTGK